jgi:hypothetical protein
VVFFSAIVCLSIGFVIDGGCFPASLKNAIKKAAPLDDPWGG